MRFIYRTIALLSLVLLASCATSSKLADIPVLEDPRIAALERVSISLEDIPAELDLSSYSIEYDIIEIDGERYVAMDQEEYRNLILILTESSEHISILRNTLSEQNRLIENALARDEMAEPD